MASKTHDSLSRMPVMQRISRFLEHAIEKTGREPTLVGNPLAARAAAAADGGLPIFHIYAQRMDAFLSDQESEGFLDQIKPRRNQDALSGVELTCEDDNEIALYPIVSLYYQSLVAAMEMTDDPDKIEISHLYSKPVTSEVLHELSVYSGPEVYSPEGDKQHAPGQ